MTKSLQRPRTLSEAIGRAFGEVRAEYETDAELFERFSKPAYFDRLIGIAPAFLVGGRGTGKTTTLRSMSYAGQAQLSGTSDVSEWAVMAAYWKAEPNTVSAFRGRGLSAADWQPIFSHYLNLRLCALVLEFAAHTVDLTEDSSLPATPLARFCASLHLESAATIRDLADRVELRLVEIESRLNGSTRSLFDLDMSLLGKPLEYLFAALPALAVSQSRPFVFCIDEYENFEPYQQTVLNTLVKAVGAAPFTFKIGVRDVSAISRETLIAGQPLQDPSDFRTVNIIRYLKDDSFVDFAKSVVEQRLASVQEEALPLADLFPGLSSEEEVELLGGRDIREQLLTEILADGNPAETHLIERMPTLHLAMIRYWSESHRQTIRSVVNFALQYPERWSTRVGNHSYEMLFTIRQKSIGPRKYYCGWRTLCQLADGNIRYLIRLVEEALLLHSRDHESLMHAVDYRSQTEAARRAGSTTLRELQGWSRDGGALTRLTLGLGRIFGGLAREIQSTTPEVNQFRVNYGSHSLISGDVERVLAEAVGQGVLLAFPGDKNARLTGATQESDFQLHPIFAAYFTYSPRRKRRLTLQAEEVLALTTRQSSTTIRQILHSRGVGNPVVPDQLRIFEDGLDAGP